MLNIFILHFFSLRQNFVPTLLEIMLLFQENDDNAIKNVFMRCVAIKIVCLKSMFATSSGF